MVLISSTLVVAIGTAALTVSYVNNLHNTARAYVDDLRNTAMTRIVLLESRVFDHEREIGAMGRRPSLTREDLLRVEPSAPSSPSDARVGQQGG